MQMFFVIKLRVISVCRCVEEMFSKCRECLCLYVSSSIPLGVPSAHWSFTVTVRRSDVKICSA